ncbi:hypothetical protein H8356DRAFT_1338155 [Neocallimastix lanati (nom. inval.)]|nr:hypothetical protein H8356DRAFT_1338155 [Neocallimastix sp. JGI-2020a]
MYTMCSSNNHHVVSIKLYLKLQERSSKVELLTIGSAKCVLRINRSTNCTIPLPYRYDICTLGNKTYSRQTHIRIFGLIPRLPPEFICGDFHPFKALFPINENGVLSLCCSSLDNRKMEVLVNTETVKRRN